MQPGMDLQRCLVQPPAHRMGSYGSDQIVQGLNTSKDGPCTASLGSLLHCLAILQGIIFFLKMLVYYIYTVLLRQHSPVSWVNTRSMGEYQIHEHRNWAGEVLCSFQNRDDVIRHKQKSFFLNGGGGKSITNPWIKSADKFKLKRNGSNHLKIFNSFEETAWPNFRQNDPLEILRDRERQANHFRKIFKQGSVPVSDSVRHRFRMWGFFPLSKY